VVFPKLGYKLALSVEHEYVDSIFQISQLRKYVVHRNDSIAMESIKIGKSLFYEENPVQILDCKVKQLHNNIIPLVMLLWAHALFRSHMGDRHGYGKSMSLLVFR